MCVLCGKLLQSCLTLWMHGLYPSRLPCQKDSPGTNIGVGCHVLLQGIFSIQGLKLCLLSLLYWQVSSLLESPEVKVKATQSCLTLCEPMDRSPWNSPGQHTSPGQKWVAYPFSSVSSQSRNQTRVSNTAGGFYQLNHQGVTWEDYLPSNLRNFSNTCLLTLSLGLALQFFYSVTRGGCFIWKLFLGEGKGNLFSIDVPKKGKMICFHLL